VADSAAIPLVGRANELDRARAAIERAHDAMGGTLLLAGEEGIGKSRLAAEALVLARRRGFLTLIGTAYALHTDLAYAPVLDAVGPFLAGLPAGRLGQLVRGLPDLSRLSAISRSHCRRGWETRRWSVRASLRRSLVW
jgi:predicted ATPase